MAPIRNAACDMADTSQQKQSDTIASLWFRRDGGAVNVEPDSCLLQITVRLRAGAGFADDRNVVIKLPRKISGGTANRGEIV